MNSRLFNLISVGCKIVNCTQDAKKKEKQINDKTTSIDMDKFSLSQIIHKGKVILSSPYASHLNSSPAELVCWAVDCAKKQCHQNYTKSLQKFKSRKVIHFIPNHDVI